MTVLDNVKEIASKFEFKPIEVPSKYENLYQYLVDNPEKIELYKTEKNDIYFIKKYRVHIPQGWYGFSIGLPIIPEWNNFIDKVLEYLISVDPNFEIHQIKLKFGGIDFYCNSKIIEDLFDVQTLIGKLLYDKNLIY